MLMPTLEVGWTGLGGKGEKSVFSLWLLVFGALNTHVERTKDQIPKTNSFQKKITNHDKYINHSTCL